MPGVLQGELSLNTEQLCVEGMQALLNASMTCHLHAQGSFFHLCTPAAQVSPHEFMQAVMAASGKRFVIDRQADPVDFLSWFLNALHADLTGGKRRKPSVVTRCFQVRGGCGVSIIKVGFQGFRSEGFCFCF